MQSNKQIKITMSLLLILLFTGFQKQNSKNFCESNALKSDTYENFKREVKCVCKNSSGSIVGIGGDWGMKSIDEAASDIRNNKAIYFVNVNGREINIKATISLKLDLNYQRQPSLKDLESCERFFQRASSQR